MFSLKREMFIVHDDHGIDPLLDISQKIVKLNLVKTHEVLSDERGRPDYISHREYGTTDLWWVVMMYNKIFCYKDVVEGLILNLPSHTSIMTLLNSVIKYDSSTSQNSAKTSVI